MKNLLIHVTRDSVCMGDDVNAPHRAFYELSNVQTIKQLINYLDKKYNLAGVSATTIAWVLKSTKPLAVFAPVWDEPRLLVEEDEALSSLIEDQHVLHLHFEYIIRCDPEEVYQALKDQHVTQQQVYELQCSVYSNIIVRDVATVKKHHEVTTKYLRVRVSTASLIAAFMFFLLGGLLPEASLFNDTRILYWLLIWLHRDIVIDIIGIVLLITLVSVFLFAFKRQWPAAIQSLIEMLICFIIILLIPVS